MVYINGFKASKADLKTLEKYIKKGEATATIRTTKKGNIAIKTSF